MSNNLRNTIEKINKNCDELDFISARNLIEYNLKGINNASSYRLLNTNAKVLMKLVIDNKNASHKKFTRAELLTIDSINKYCTNFDISMLKRLLKNSFELLQRTDIVPLLNQDAKIVLGNMGAILGSPQLRQ